MLLMTVCVIRVFFSYIQLHEFEALLFSSNKGFECYFSDVACK